MFLLLTKFLTIWNYASHLLCLFYSNFWTWSKHLGNAYTSLCLIFTLSNFHMLVLCTAMKRKPIVGVWKDLKLAKFQSWFSWPDANSSWTDFWLMRETLVCINYIKFINICIFVGWLWHSWSFTHELLNCSRRWRSTTSCKGRGTHLCPGGTEPSGHSSRLSICSSLASIFERRPGQGKQSWEAVTSACFVSMPLWACHIKVS